ncbi:MAG: hypothetical protein RIM33_02970 [Alphaproteobacteria bacterium]
MFDKSAYPAALPKGFRLNPPKHLAPYRLAAIWVGWLWLPCSLMFVFQTFFGVFEPLLMSLTFAVLVLALIASWWRRYLDKSLPWTDDDGNKYAPHEARQLNQAFEVRRLVDKQREYTENNRGY